MLVTPHIKVLVIIERPIIDWLTDWLVGWLKETGAWKGRFTQWGIQCCSTVQYERTYVGLGFFLCKLTFKFHIITLVIKHCFPFCWYFVILLPICYHFYVPIRFIGSVMLFLFVTTLLHLLFFICDLDMMEHETLPSMIIPDLSRGLMNSFQQPKT